jgi:hypothetical protein
MKTIPKNEKMKKKNVSRGERLFVAKKTTGIYF